MSDLKPNAPVETVIARLEAAKRIVITAHVNPDGDASGSSLALALLMRARGKTIRLAIPMTDLGAPGVLETFQSFQDDSPIAAPDLFVCLDCATVPRLALPELRDKAGVWPTLNIDHHSTNTRYGQLNYVIGDYSSTGEVIYDIAKAAGWPIDRDIAEALWVAIVTDTGRFSYSSTSPSTLRCGADLLSHGVRAPWLNDELFCVRDRKELDIHRRALSSLETWFDGRVAVISLTECDYEETGCTKSCTETFADIPRSVRGSVIAVFLYRLPGDPKTHASIRARAPYSACALAQVFGGGGHELAAGATLDVSLGAAKAAIKDALCLQLKS
jgi:phosphoesterase RecJ-like protein